VTLGGAGRSGGAGGAGKTGGTGSGAGAGAGGAGLERAYRRLLLAYPRWYRDQRGEEILGTLLDAAADHPDQRHPDLADALPLIGHGLAVRADLSGDGALGELLGVAASPGLASAAVLATVVFFLGEWNPWSSSVPLPAAHFGPFLTIGPVVYLAWVLAAVVDATTHSRGRRGAAALAVAITVLPMLATRGPVLDHLVGAGRPALFVGYGRPPLFVLLPLAGLGLPALLGPDAGRRRPTWPAVAAALATMVVLVAGAVIPTLAGSAAFPPAIGYARVTFYQVGFATLAAWIPLLAAIAFGAAAVAVVARRRRAPAAGALVALMAPWLVISVAHAPRFSTSQLAAGLLTVAVAAVAGVGVQDQRRRARLATRPSRSSIPG